MNWYEGYEEKGAITNPSANLAPGRWIYQCTAQLGRSYFRAMVKAIDPGANLMLGL